MVPLLGVIEAINDGKYSSLARVEILRLFLVIVNLVKKIESVFKNSKNLKIVKVYFWQKFKNKIFAKKYF